MVILALISSLTQLIIHTHYLTTNIPTAENATRQCHWDGHWDNYTNYDRCLHLPQVTPVDEFEPNVELPTIIYYTGYTISLISLTLAVAVFLHFKWVLVYHNH